jgi:hypothetical protein
MLNPGTKIILRITRGDLCGLALLSPKVGDYTVTVPEELHLKTGDEVVFHCPVCAGDLTSQADARFGEVLRDRASGGSEYVYFHRKYGEHATFVVSRERVRAFGDDAAKYNSVNFFGVGRNQS